MNKHGGGEGGGWSWRYLAGLKNKVGVSKPGVRCASGEGLETRKYFAIGLRVGVQPSFTSCEGNLVCWLRLIAKLTGL